MTANQIRAEYQSGNARNRQEEILAEIAAQLAELNEKLSAVEERLEPKALAATA